MSRKIKSFIIVKLHGLMLLPVILHAEELNSTATPAIQQITQSNPLNTGNNAWNYLKGVGIDPYPDFSATISQIINFLMGAVVSLLAPCLETSRAPIKIS